MLKNEWKKLFKNKFMIVVLIAIMLIPTIYTTVFLGSMWDPYGEVENLPVAVVNQDEEVTYNEKELHVGEDLIENLKKNNSLDFNFVDANTAATGLANGTYYMVITIPENFSENATTLSKEHPKKMELYYETNPGQNYIASKMSETAVNKIQANIKEKITTQYTETVFEQLGTIGEGFSKAADGALQITDGSNQLISGNTDISNGLNTLKESTFTLQEGSSALGQGINAYTTGVSSLESGAALLEQKSSSLNAGVETVANGLTELKGGSTAILSGMNVMSENLGNYLSGKNLEQMQTLQDGLLDVNTGIKSINQLVGNINTSLNNNDIATAKLQMAALVQAVGQLEGNADVVLNGGSQTITQLKTGLQVVQEALDKTGTTAQDMGLIQAMTSVNTGVFDLEAGVNGEAGLKTGVAAYTDGVAEVAKGAKTLTENNAELRSGIAKLTDGAGQLNEGTVKLSDGSNELSGGLKELKSGSITLADNLNEAADNVNNTKTDEEAVEMFASPVEIVASEYSTIDNNGSAMAAYMMGVGLWVACIAFCIMYPLVKPAGDVKSGFGWWLSKASVYFVIAVLQGIIMVFLLKAILGFHPQYLGKTLLVASFASVAFMSVMYFFNLCFGKVGSFLMLIFMVLQLGGAAGTYPLELSAEFYHKIHDRMPFTYSVNAFRSTISTGTDITDDLVVFLGMIVVFNLLSILVFYIKKRKEEPVTDAELLTE